MPSILLRIAKRHHTRDRIANQKKTINLDKTSNIITFAFMKQEYQHIEKERIREYKGVSYSIEEIKEVFPKQVKEKLLDEEGTSELVNDLKTTGFDDTLLVDILKLDDIITEHKSWRIGEAFAEYYIETNLSARFYYNELRNARNVFGNKTGADLLGFIELEGKTVFLFGEVKTSSEDKTPPNVLQGRHGMIDQLKDLATNTNITRQLVRNFGFKIINLQEDNPFRIDYIEAFNNYTSDEFHLIGVLVRDTEPNEKDLKSRYKNLSKTVSKGIGLNLTALYIPIKIEDWNKIITN